LATSGGEEVRLWDLTILDDLPSPVPENGITIPELFNLSGGSGITFSPDGNTLVAGFNDGSFQVYNLSLGDLLVLAHMRVNRTFTAEECRQYRIDPCPAES
jgi:WD40 repeat protein